jgi:hypothetical protein
MFNRPAAKWLLPEFYRRVAAPAALGFDGAGAAGRHALRETRSVLKNGSHGMAKGQMAN